MIKTKICFTAISSVISICYSLRFNLVVNADTQKSSFFVVLLLPNVFYMTQYLNIMLITVLQSNCVVPADKWETPIIFYSNNLPHIFNGASNSSNIGWLRKISRDLRQRPRISDSVSWTFFPGLDPLTI